MNLPLPNRKDGCAITLTTRLSGFSLANLYIGGGMHYPMQAVAVIRDEPKTDAAPRQSQGPKERNDD